MPSGLSNIGMLLSNLVMYFIILTTAATLFQKRQNRCAIRPPELAEALAPSWLGDAAVSLLAIV